MFDKDNTKVTATLYTLESSLPLPNSRKLSQRLDFALALNHNEMARVWYLFFLSTLFTSHSISSLFIYLTHFSSSSFFLFFKRPSSFNFFAKIKPVYIIPRLWLSLLLTLSLSLAHSLDLIIFCFSPFCSHCICAWCICMNVFMYMYMCVCVCVCVCVFVCV